MDKVVIEGLRSIKNSINLSTGFSHPSDRSSTIEMLRKLKAAGYLLDGHAIGNWALQNEFSTKYANELKDYVDGVNAGKKYRIDKQAHWKDNIVDILAHRANMG